MNLRRQSLSGQMGRPTELSAGVRRRCRAGHQGHSCKKRTCEICGLTWARDWRMVLLHNLRHVGGLVMMSAVTPPGREELPYDESQCAHLGAHVHGKRYGCKVDADALHEWSRDISRRWKRLHNAARNAVKRRHGRCLPLLMRAWEPQARGPAHVHPVFDLRQPFDTVLAHAYFDELDRLAPRHRFGMVGTKERNSARVMAAERAAAYLSSYFVTGNGEKAQLQENARNPHLPRLLIWLSPRVTRKTGFTMRRRRMCRQLWAIRLGFLPPPSWTGAELARTILAAGAWPAAARAP